MGVTVKLNKNYSKLALNLMHSQVERALEKCGLLAEGYAQVKLTEQDAVDTGNLRNSINHKVVTNKNEHSVYVGTNVEYAPYIEFGTGGGFVIYDMNESRLLRAFGTPAIDAAIRNPDYHPTCSCGLGFQPVSRLCA